jgi:flagella basal body P-ring formation protein FlgA
MRKSILNILVFSLASALAALAGGNILLAVQPPGLQATIQLMPEISVSRDRMVLGDVCQVSGVQDTQMLERLLSVEIGNAPLPGKVRDIKVEYLKLRLLQSGLDPAGFVFSGVQASKVVRRSQLIPGQEIVRRAREFIVAAMPWQPDEVVLEEDQRVQDVIVADGEFAVSIAARPGVDLQGKVILTARIESATGEIIQVPVQLTIRRFTDVVLAKQRINKGELISGDAVYVQKQEVSGLPRDVLLDGSEAVGKRARGYIQPHQVLAAHLVEEPPLVKRGENVTVIYETDAFRITTRAQARQDGCKNELIRVRNSESKKEIEAQVSGPGTVRIGS